MARLYAGDVQGLHGETPVRHTAAGRASMPAAQVAWPHLAAAVHPDRWQGSPVAEEVTKRVLALRDTLTRTD
jgi:hypothetical protein